MQLFSVARLDVSEAKLLCVCRKEQLSMLLASESLILG